MNTLSRYLGVVALGAAFALPAFAQKYTEIKRDDMPREVRQAADDQARGASDVKYQRQERDGKTFYSIHYTKDGKRLEARLDESGKIVDGPQAARDQSTARDSAKQGGGDEDVKYHGISARDVDREVPAAVRRTMDQHTKGASDLFYQSQVRSGKQFYSVHYMKDGKRMFVRVDDKGKLAFGPVESRNQQDAAKTAKPDKGVAAVETKREAITVDQLPASVRRTVESATGGGTDHSFVKQTRGNEVSYVVEFTKDGERTSALIDPEGRVIEGETYAAAPPAPAPAPTPTPAPAPDPAVAKAEAEAQTAAARESATAPYRLLNSADDLPAEVRAAAEKELAGSSDPMFQRYIENGQTAYTIHFNGPEGRRNYMAIDQTGKVIVEPRKSKWQDGSKGVRFETVGADALPAEVKKSIEGLAGTAHVFVKRTQPNGKELYLVQYSAGGERMEAEVSAEGKMIGKARKAEEQPFTTLDKKKN